MHDTVRLADDARSRGRRPDARRLRSLSDDELLDRLCELLRESRGVESDLIAHIGEVDQRRLYAREGAPSMFVYCTETLRLSEHEAYLRITVARAARDHPILLAMLGDGRLHLSGIAKLAPHLTEANREAVLRRAAGLSKREIEELVAELAPRPDVPVMIRKLPGRHAERRPAMSSEATPASVPEPGPSVTGPRTPQGPRTVEPLAPARYRIQFTASAAFHEKLERLTALMRGGAAEADLAAILEVAVTEKLQRLEARRFGSPRTPRREPKDPEKSDASVSRHVPAPVRRAVYERDGGRCGYVSRDGKRCTARARLEFHHVHPYARGGPTTAKNLRLMCRTHNAELAERFFGAAVMATYRRRRRREAAAVPLAGGSIGPTASSRAGPSPSS